LYLPITTPPPHLGTARNISRMNMMSPPPQGDRSQERAGSARKSRNDMCYGCDLLGCGKLVTVF